MAQGKVSVNNLNLGQGPVTEIERYFLFIGPAAKNVGKLIPLSSPRSRAARFAASARRRRPSTGSTSRKTGRSSAASRR